jgi:hypothetical protein
LKLIGEAVWNIPWTPLTALSKAPGTVISSTSRISIRDE